MSWQPSMRAMLNSENGLVVAFFEATFALDHSPATPKVFGQNGSFLREDMMHKSGQPTLGNGLPSFLQLLVKQGESHTCIRACKKSTSKLQPLFQTRQKAQFSGKASSNKSRPKASLIKTWVCHFLKAPLWGGFKGQPRGKHGERNTRIICFYKKKNKTTCHRRVDFIN